MFCACFITVYIVLYSVEDAGIIGHSCFRFVINVSICIVNIRSGWQLFKKKKKES